MGDSAAGLAAGILVPAARGKRIRDLWSLMVETLPESVKLVQEVDGDT